MVTYSKKTEKERVELKPAECFRKKHSIIPTFTDNKPDTIIIHGGCNDVVNKNLILQI